MASYDYHQSSSIQSMLEEDALPPDDDDGEGSGKAGPSRQGGQFRQGGQDLGRSRPGDISRFTDKEDLTRMKDYSHLENTFSKSIIANSNDMKFNSTSTLEKYDILSKIALMQANKSADNTLLKDKWAEEDISMFCPLKTKKKYFVSKENTKKRRHDKHQIIGCFSN